MDIKLTNTGNQVFSICYNHIERSYFKEKVSLGEAEITPNTIAIALSEEDAEEIVNYYNNARE